MKSLDFHKLRWSCTWQPRNLIPLEKPDNVSVWIELYHCCLTEQSSHQMSCYELNSQKSMQPKIVSTLFKVKFYNSSGYKAFFHPQWTNYFEFNCSFVLFTLPKSSKSHSKHCNIKSISTILQSKNFSFHKPKKEKASWVSRDRVTDWIASSALHTYENNWESLVVSVEYFIFQVCLLLVLQI